jgi:uncharacterized RDD family membrane protein YckC
MFCSKCGANVEQGKPFCGACGQPVTGYAVGSQGAATPATSSAVPPLATNYTPAPAGQTYPIPAAAPTVAYAGFWLRLVAAIVDGIVLGIPLAPVFLVIFLGKMRNLQDLQNVHDPAAILTLIGPLIVLILAISAIASWLYWGLCESSAWQATLGKKVLGLTVTDLEGRRISFGRASGRFWAGRGVSSIPYLGGTYFAVDCICAGFTARKQAIHDMIASTLVLRKL